MVICATFCQLVEPPLTAGADGSVRSRRTVLPAVGDAGTQLDTRPAASSARNWTSVSPWAVIFGAEPATGEPQIVPPSVDRRYW